MNYPTINTGHAHCIPSTFTPPHVFGAEITSINTHLVTNFTAIVPAEQLFNTPTANATNVDFCNVTVSYTHPGQGDNISVTAWLPIDSWNERMEGVGGGGWVAGGPISQLAYPELVTSRSLYDQAVIGKSLIKDFYGRSPKKSYWNGCSQGGRQGMMLAQRYPGLYDGVAAAAPAINWNAFFTAMYWPQLIMNLAGKYPHGCELDTITEAAVSACDGLDGVLDGVISDADTCVFDPFTVVGTVFNCASTNTTMQVSHTAAVVANATWSGPQTSKGNFLWYGPHRGADLSGALTAFGLAGTRCTGDVCVGAPLYLGTEWMALFIERNPDFDLTSISHEQYDEIVYSGRQQFASTIETADPDLSQFKTHGGKILTFHGLADPVIPTRGSEHYYNAVQELDPDIHDFYRLFLAPGVAHCFGGSGGQPHTVLEALVEWVENGTAPETLPVSFTSAKGTTYDQILCPYPQKSVYTLGSDPTLAESYHCV
ncbi:hypothetical protein N7537_002835 [Penicillium hordei]|uniref:Carboxylic ester hydrolase n=1 Tax=Penicillium hordei TaxID=40994 RepID=A0AAD6EIQ3_9EURO|nr:uncharacterized protein N7537_002835 [Penicillium hordei]KAJ5617721.1 hypothetical protein N7537_002835 [Penicillium hordei]